MVAPDQLVEVAHVEALVALAVEPEDPLELGQGDPPGRGRLAAAIEQPGDSVLFKPRAPAAHGPRTQADDIGHMQPRLAAMQGVQEGLVDRHGTLHGRTRIGHRHLLGGDSLSRGLLERSRHLLSGAVT